MTELRKHRAALVMLVASATLFGVMAFVAKLASEGLSGAEVAMIRFAVGIVPILVIPSVRRAAFTYQRLDLLFYRGFFGGLAVLLYFTAIQHIAVGVATLLNYTTPIFSAIFAGMFAGEPANRRVVIPLAIAFCGVALVVRGNAHDGAVIGFGGWELLGMCSAILSGAAVTAIRVARRTENAWAVFGSFTALGFVTTAPFAIAEWKTPDLRQWILLVLVGVISIAAQLFMTYAYRWIDTVTQGVISQLAVVVAMVLGVFFLRDRFGLLTGIGSVLTIVGVLSVLVTTPSPAAPVDEAR